MSADPTWLQDYGPHLGFIVRQIGRFVLPGVIAIPLALAFPSLRRALRDKLAMAAFCAVPLLWMFLVPWSAVFVAAMDGEHHSPWWAQMPLYICFWGWPAVAGILIWRAKGARIVSAGYALLNAVAWLFVGFVAAMAINGDWI